MADRSSFENDIKENLKKAKAGNLEKKDVSGVIRHSGIGIRDILLKTVNKIKWIKNIPVFGKAAQWLYWLLKAPRMVKHLLIDLEELAAVSRQKESSLQCDVDELRAKLQLARTAVAGNAEILAGIMKSREAKAGPDALLAQKAKELSSQSADDFYFEFENKFRGSKAAIRERQKQYLPNVLTLGRKPEELKVLDLGSGRGEWLELLREHNIPAAGIDLNGRMVKECLKLGLNVKEGDAISFLRAGVSDTIDVISAFHLVEHLGAGNLVSLFREAVRVLKPGGLIIFETPNPESLLVMSPNFYLDLSHLNPIPPQTLEFLAGSVGFEKIEIKRVTPVKFVEFEETDRLKNILEKFNMAQEYALIAAKPG